MDYKSGQRKLDKILVEHGVQLQLLAYLAAVRSWPPEVWAQLNLPMNLLGAPASRRPVGSQKTELAGETPALPGIESRVEAIAPAGVFYVNLRGQYESGGTRDEALADAAGARKRAYRHAGRFDTSALSRLDRTNAADQFNYRLNKDGGVRSNSVEALPRAEFEALLDRVETQLKGMGRAIFSGAAQVDPYCKGHELPCDFCDYRAVCRIDPWTHRYRVLRPSAEKTFDNSCVL